MSMARTTTKTDGQDREKTAAAQRRAADDLKDRAGRQPVIAEVLSTAHQRLGLWRLCVNRQCWQGHACRGDTLDCAARRWPVACSCLERIAATRASGRTPAQVATDHLKGWLDDNGLLTFIQPRMVCWLD